MICKNVVAIVSSGHMPGSPTQAVVPRVMGMATRAPDRVGSRIAIIAATIPQPKLGLSFRPGLECSSFAVVSAPLFGSHTGMCSTRLLAARTLRNASAGVRTLSNRRATDASEIDNRGRRLLSKYNKVARISAVMPVSELPHQTPRPV